MRRSFGHHHRYTRGPPTHRGREPLFLLARLAHSRCPDRRLLLGFGKTPSVVHAHHSHNQSSQPSETVDLRVYKAMHGLHHTTVLPTRPTYQGRFANRKSNDL